MSWNPMQHPWQQPLPPRSRVSPAPRPSQAPPESPVAVPLLVHEEALGSGTSRLAVVSLVLGIVGFPVGLWTFGIPSMLAIALGFWARAQSDVSGSGSARRMATAGIVLGAAFLVLAIVALVVMVGLYASCHTQCLGQ